VRISAKFALVAMLRRLKGDARGLYVGFIHHGEDQVAWKRRRYTPRSASEIDQIGFNRTVSSRRIRLAIPWFHRTFPTTTPLSAADQTI
jgi:hypothetical protein